MTIGTILPDCTVGISNWLSKNQPFMTISLSLLGWCFIIIGWLYNNRQSNLREDRKELRASIDNVIDEIHNIQLKAIEYYTTPAKTSAKLAFEIKSSQARLIVKFERLSKLHNGFFKIESLVSFIDVITGGDFEEKKRRIRKYSDQNDNLLIEISYSADSLIDMIESSFCEIVEKSKRTKKSRHVD